MKPYYLLIPLLFFVSCKDEKPAAPFEGVVTFTVSMQSKNPMIPNSYMKNLQGDTMRLFVRNGDYRMEYNGGDIEAMYYDHLTNTLYSKFRNKDQVNSTDCRVEEKPVQSFTWQPGDTTIAGRTCHCVKVVTPDMTKRICYDSTMSVNPEHFINHTWDHADIYYSRTRSVFLSYYRETPQFTMQYDAVKVEERKVRDEELKISGD